VIELLLQAERALSVGLVDEAERMYAQTVAADPRNAIAVVGLARVALERADDARAYRLARQALAIDPENVAAARLAGRLEEVYAARGMPEPGSEPGPAPQIEPALPAPDASAPTQPAPEPPPPHRTPLDRLFRRNRP
jgi:hypothetical protein